MYLYYSKFKSPFRAFESITFFVLLTSIYLETEFPSWSSLHLEAESPSEEDDFYSNQITSCFGFMGSVYVTQKTVFWDFPLLSGRATKLGIFTWKLDFQVGFLSSG